MWNRSKTIFSSPAGRPSRVAPMDAFPHVHRDGVQCPPLGVRQLGIVRRQTLRLAIFGHKLDGRPLGSGKMKRDPVAT